MTCGWEGLFCLRWNKRIIAPRLFEYWIKERHIYLVWTFQFQELFKQTVEHFASQSFALHFCNMKNESERVPMWNVPDVCLPRRDSGGRWFRPTNAGQQTQGFVSENEEAEMLSFRRHSHRNSVPFPLCKHCSRPSASRPVETCGGDGWRQLEWSPVWQSLQWCWCWWARGDSGEDAGTEDNQTLGNCVLVGQLLFAEVGWFGQWFNKLNAKIFRESMSGYLKRHVLWEKCFYSDFLKQCISLKQQYPLPTTHFITSKVYDTNDVTEGTGVSDD